jgi:hypothetical protein
MKLTKVAVAVAAVGALATLTLAESGSALWRRAPTADLPDASMLVWTRSSETVQYAAGLPYSWNGSSVNLTAGGTRHRARVRCSNGLYYYSNAMNGYTQYENSYYSCNGAYNATHAWGELDQ